LIQARNGRWSGGVKKIRHRCMVYCIFKFSHRLTRTYTNRQKI